MKTALYKCIAVFCLAMASVASLGCGGGSPSDSSVPEGQASKPGTEKPNDAPTK